MSLVLGLGLEHSCPWPREVLSSERLSLALASFFFCVLGLSIEPCVLDSTSDLYQVIELLFKKNFKRFHSENKKKQTWKFYLNQMLLFKIII